MLREADAAPPDIMNTDQGSQFTSFVWTDRLKRAGCRISMDGKGRCIDNVFIERLWRHHRARQRPIPTVTTRAVTLTAVRAWEDPRIILTQRHHYRRCAWTGRAVLCETRSRAK